MGLIEAIGDIITCNSPNTRLPFKQIKKWPQILK